MLDIGWSEMLVIAVVAIVVIGPKDLPGTLRMVGRWIGKARAMAREFQSSLDDIARDAELDELRKQISDVSDFDVRKEIEGSFDTSASAGGLDGAPEPVAGEAGTTASDGVSPGAAAPALEPPGEAEGGAAPGPDENLKSEAHG